MKKIAHTFIKHFIFLIAILQFLFVHTRSCFRETSQPIQTISVKWAHKHKKYILLSSYFEESPFKLYDAAFLKKHIIQPHAEITYRNNPQRSILGKTIIWYIKSVLKELRQGKQTYSYFTVLQNKDFNKKNCTGLIVLKLKHHPFVVKIFIETPKSFIQPFSKGFHPIFFFFMAGGVTRHLSGFTRIQNLIIVQKKINDSPYWSKKVSLPRKWFWTPSLNNMMEIEGINIGKKNSFKVQIPGTYCIIADEIQQERSFSIFNPEETKISLDLCNYLDQRIDSHIDNFMIEKNTHKIAIIDTEHFPTMVGLSETINFNSYTQWYVTLMKKTLKVLYGRTKKDRLDAKMGNVKRLSIA